MKNTQKKMKVLSPVGSWEALEAAINNGADVVYLGTKNFNARRKNKGNFTYDTLKEAVQLAHFHGVEVNVTLNTLVKNREVDVWFKALDAVYQSGADAVIIQDLYLLPFVKKQYPDLKVHISTQASIMNLAGLQEWQEFADLSVLSREMDFNEVRYVSERADIQIEVFAHGHLCISYSGQCLISSLIGNRSGNRGLCASSCRKEYNEEGYLLSPKDLALLNEIPKMVEAGINTIKIEGRMKSPEYVGIVTKYYRAAIDRYYSGNWRPFTQEDLNQIRMGFNRDFTTGFFMNNRYEHVLSTTLPTHRGIFLGEVRGGYVKLEHDLVENDGVGLWDSYDNKMYGAFVTDMRTFKEKVSSAKKGELVKINDTSFRNGRLVYLTSKSGGKSFVGKTKKYPLLMEIISSGVDKHLELACEFRNVEKSFVSEVPFQKAKNSSLSVEGLSEKLNKNKYFIVEVKGDLESDLFMPSSMISKIREELENCFLPKVERESPGIIEKKNIEIQEKKKSEKELCVRVDEISLVEKLAPFADVLYYDLFETDFGKAMQLAKKLNPNIKFFAFTHMALGDTDIQKIKLTLAKEKPDGVMFGNQGLLSVDKELDFDLEKHGFYTLNVFNGLGMEYMEENNIKPIISIELNAQELAEFSNKDFMVFVHGRPIVMNFKGERKEEKLTDEKRMTFPLEVTPAQNTEMYYSRRIAFLDKALRLKAKGMQNYYLEFLHKDYWNKKEQAVQEIKVYRAILNNTALGDLTLLKRGTTLGNFAKAVM